MAAEGGSEWPTALDVAALVADGWNPVPFREFIVKIHSRCDLACDYCYMYEMADQSWRDQPRRMSREVAERTAMRIGEHARAYKLGRIALVLHGGEPLLAGQDLISYLVTAVRDAVGPAVTVDASVQTNAVGLDDSYLRLFDELDVRVGVSLDGTADAHNRHRRFASGRGSHEAVAAGLGRLANPSYRHCRRSRSAWRTSRTRTATAGIAAPPTPAAAAITATYMETSGIDCILTRRPT
jgi:uncharacterized protein